MSNFKRFNSSDNNNNYNSSYVGREGELTWDPSNGLRIHDGYTGGGNSVGGGFSGNYSDLSNRPSGNTAVHDLIGSGTSLNTGKFLQQTGNGTSDWISLPTVYDSLTVNTLNGGLGPASGSSASSSGAMSYGGQNAQFDQSSFLTGTLSSIQPGWTVADGLGWTATITQINAYGYQGMLVLDTDQNWTGVGPYYFYSSDYVAPAPADLTLTIDTNNWVFGTDGRLVTPGPIDTNVINQPDDGALYLKSDSTESSTIQINTYHTVWTFDQNNLTQSNGNLSIAGKITGSLTVTAPRPYAELTPAAGARAFISDSNVAAAGNFGSQVSGSGSYTVPAWSDGTYWYIG